MPECVTVIVVLLVSACATTPTMKSVAGTYERKDRDSDHNRRVFLDNGVSEFYVNDIKKRDDRWKITKNGELHIDGVGGVSVFSINKEWTQNLCSEMIENNFKLEWACETRSDRLSEELIDVMYE